MKERVVIVGAGVMGCVCALALLRKGFSVTLLERALPGAESSAAAAGILGAQSEVSGAGPFLELCLASRDLFPEHIRDVEELSGVCVGYQRTGVLEVALDPGEGRLAVGRAQWMMDRGLRVEVLDRNEALQLEPTLNPRLVGANYYPDDQHLDPRQYARALAAAVARLGGAFRNGIQVSGLLRSGERVTGVMAVDAPIPADHVIIAGGAWSSLLQDLPPLRTRIKPMAGQIVQVESRPPLLHHVVYGFKGYVVPRADGRVVMGSTLEERGFDKAVTAGGLHRITGMALEMVPPLAEARFMESWAGLRPATADGMPLLGQAAPGLTIAAGHYRNGILLAPMTGVVIADLVVGRTPNLDVTPFTPCPGNLFSPQGVE